MNLNYQFLHLHHHHLSLPFFSLSSLSLYLLAHLYFFEYLLSDSRSFPSTQHNQFPMKQFFFGSSRLNEKPQQPTTNAVAFFSSSAFVFSNIAVVFSSSAFVFSCSSFLFAKSSLVEEMLSSTVESCFMTFSNSGVKSVKISNPSTKFLTN